jgi:3-oxoacyl-[acyl-carrier protein] reductase
MKKIMISGGSKGLGKYLIEKYLETGNFKVVSFARSDIDIEDPNLEFVSGIDASNIDDVKKIKHHLKDCEYLINNVGMAYDGILATQGIESIDRMLEVNLNSVLYLTKFWLRERLRKREDGSCVTISSIISQNGFSGLSVYSATKGALNSMVKSLAREMGPQNFRFNAVLPGYFESDLSRSLSDSKKNQIIRRTPLGRLATTEDIFPIVEFLTSDKSKFMTGQLISVDGGLTV